MIDRRTDDGTIAEYGDLGEITGRLEKKRVSFASLMPNRVRTILLVSSLYDAFTFQEDGNLTEMLFSEYLELNLSYAPVLTRVSTGREAIESVHRETPDLVISMLRVGEMDVLEFGRAIKDIAGIPLVLLAYDTRELVLLEEREDISCVDGVFVWQGDVRIFLAIIKHIEDQLNAWHDAEAAGVKSIILVEDSIRFYSAYLPLLYTEIMEQTQDLMAEGANRMQRLMRMRARSKILLASNYETGVDLYDKYRRHVLGIIVDAHFPRGGESDPQAGAAFIKKVRESDEDVPILMQSTRLENKEVAASLGTAFLHKSSPKLLHEVRDFLRSQLGFGDFVFRRPDGSIEARAQDLREMVETVRDVSDESLLYHASRNDFSMWLMARTEFDLAKALRPRKAAEFPSAAHLRAYLLAALEAYRDQSRAGLVEDFSGERFDPESGFSKIGPGSLGGKGRGLAFINSLLNSYDIENQIEGVTIFVPPTAVVATGVFDQFMEESGLTSFVLEDREDEEIRKSFLAVRLPAEAEAALRDFLKRAKYPLAVRSSSLLEDSSYQPFAGIFDTYMLPNNHEDPEVRFDELSRAIRLIYASTYYKDSKAYIDATPNRLEEEKMAVLIQQVVGRRHGDYVYPDIAGVARSYDYYPIKGAKPEGGVASVALGLGRTVVDGGRCVRFSPEEPRRLYQFSSTEDYLEYAQREFLALDLGRPASSGQEGKPPDSNLIQLGLETAMEHDTLGPVGSVYSPDNDAVYDGVYREGVKLVTMAGVLSGDHFPLPETLAFLMDVGKAGFSCHVEIEFAANLRPRGEGPSDFAFLQIRPLVFGAEAEKLSLGDVELEDTICLSEAALGHGRFRGIRDLVYVRFDTFDRSDTVKIAGEVGALNAQLRKEGRPYLLIGPGRWGSADPWLGIPVTWADISGVQCIVEADMKDIKVAPSQGTHFFQNITSFGLGYFTIHAREGKGSLDLAWLDQQSAESETEHLRHLRFGDPLEIVVDSREGRGVVWKPGLGHLVTDDEES